MTEFRSNVILVHIYFMRRVASLPKSTGWILEILVGNESSKWFLYKNGPSEGGQENTQVSGISKTRHIGLLESQNGFSWYPPFHSPLALNLLFFPESYDEVYSVKISHV